MNHNKNADDLRHDTMLLLRKYRQVKWALEVSSNRHSENYRSEQAEPWMSIFTQPSLPVQISATRHWKDARKAWSGAAR